MPARSNRSSRPGGAPGGRVTPKGTRTDQGHAGSSGPSSATPTGRSRFGAGPDRGIRPSGFRPPAPRAGTRGNR